MSPKTKTQSKSGKIEKRNPAKAPTEPAVATTEVPNTLEERRKESRVKKVKNVRQWLNRTVNRATGDEPVLQMGWADVQPVIEHAKITGGPEARGYAEQITPFYYCGAPAPRPVISKLISLIDNDSQASVVGTKATDMSVVPPYDIIERIELSESNLSANLVKKLESLGLITVADLVYYICSGHELLKSAIIGKAEIVKVHELISDHLKQMEHEEDEPEPPKADSIADLLDTDWGLRDEVTKQYEIQHPADQEFVDQAKELIKNVDRYGAELECRAKRLSEVPSTSELARKATADTCANEIDACAYAAALQAKRVIGGAHGLTLDKVRQDIVPDHYRLYAAVKEVFHVFVVLANELHLKQTREYFKVKYKSDGTKNKKIYKRSLNSIDAILKANEPYKDPGSFSEWWKPLKKKLDEVIHTPWAKVDKSDRIVVSPDNQSVVVDGTRRPLKSSEAAVLIKALLAAGGEPMALKDLPYPNNYPPISRPDRVRQNLPREVNDLIESEPGKGTYLTIFK